MKSIAYKITYRVIIYVLAILSNGIYMQMIHLSVGFIM